MVIQNHELNSSLGGEIDEEFSLKTTHIICGASISALERSIDESLRVRIYFLILLKGVQLHTPDWISESLKNKKRISENEFRLYHTGDTPKKKRVEEVKEEKKLKIEPEITAKKKLKFACEKDQSETFNHNEGKYQVSFIKRTYQCIGKIGKYLFVDWGSVEIHGIP
jgi:hypothetical protein